MGKDLNALLSFVVGLLGAALVIKIIDDANRQTRYKCPRCKGLMRRSQNPCPNCRTPVRWM